MNPTKKDSPKPETVTFHGERGSCGTMRLLPRWLILAPALGASPLVAQTRGSAGVTAGTAKLSDQRSEQALSAALLLQANPWLSFSATPSLVHVRDVVKGAAVTSNGLGDVPVAAAAAHV